MLTLVLSVIYDFPGKLRFVKFVGSSEWIVSRRDKYPSRRIAEPKRLFSFSLPRNVSRKRHTREYVVRGTNFHRSPVVPVRPLLRRTNFSFCLPTVVLPLSDDGPLDEFKVNLGHETVLWREGWVGSAPGRPVIVNPLGAPGSPWSLCYDRTLGIGALGITIRLGHL